MVFKLNVFVFFRIVINIADNILFAVHPLPNTVMMIFIKNNVLTYIHRLFSNSMVGK